MSAPVNLRLEYRDDCLVIELQGRDILERMEVTMKTIAAAIRARPVRAALVDFRTVPGPVTFLERHQLGDMASRHLPRIPIGALMREDQADSKRIGQLTARNRGANVEIFTDQATAEVWLKDAPALDGNPPASPT